MTINQSLMYPNWLNNVLNVQKFPISKLTPITGVRVMLTFIGVVVVAVIAFKLFMLFFSSSESAVERATRKYMENPTSANYKIMVATRMRNEKKRG